MIRLLGLPSNPLFRFELLSVRGVRTVRGVWISTIYNIVLILSVTLIIIAGLGSVDAIRDDEPIYFIFLIMGYIFLIINFYTSFLPDFGSIFYSLGALNADISGERIDVMRLAIGEYEIIKAKHGVVTVRAWRLVLTWMASRFAALLSLLIGSLMALADPEIQQDIMQSLLNSELAPTVFSEALIVAAIWIPLSIISAIVFLVFEPIWRMRTITALGVLISARTENRLMAFLFGVFGVFGMLMALGMLVSVVSIPLSLGLGFMITYVESMNNPNLLILLARIAIYAGIPLLTIFTIIATYFFYRWVRNWLLKEAVKALFRG